MILNVDGNMIWFFLQNRSLDALEIKGWRDTRLDAKRQYKNILSNFRFVDDCSLDEGGEDEMEIRMWVYSIFTGKNDRRLKIWILGWRRSNPGISDVHPGCLVVPFTERILDGDLGKDPKLIWHVEVAMPLRQWRGYYVAGPM